MKNMLDNSMKILGTDYIDIYWIHNPMDVEKYTPMIAPLYKSGLIKSLPIIGVTKPKHVLDAKVASEVNLTQEEIKYLEETAEKLEISTIRMLEKEMK